MKGILQRMPEHPLTPRSLEMLHNINLWRYAAPVDSFSSDHRPYFVCGDIVYGLLASWFLLSGFPEVIPVKLKQKSFIKTSLL